MQDHSIVCLQLAFMMDATMKCISLNEGLCLQLEKDLGLTLTPTATTIRDHARTVLALGLVEA